MANMRKKGKKRANFWLNGAENSLLEWLKDEMDLNKSDVIRSILVLAAVGKLVPGITKEDAIDLIRFLSNNNVEGVETNLSALVTQAKSKTKAKGEKK